MRAKEQGLEKYLTYDPYRRVSLRDHFFSPSVTADALKAVRHDELGDFHNARYEFTAEDGGATLQRDGLVVDAAGREHPIRIVKRIALAPDSGAFTIHYEVDNIGDGACETLFGVEFAVNLLSGATFDRYYRSDERDLAYAKLATTGWEEGLSHIALRDDWQQLEMGLRLDLPARIFRFPLETVSQSEGGQERIYQGSVVIPCWPVTLEAGGRARFEIVLEALDTGHQD